MSKRDRAIQSAAAASFFALALGAPCAMAQSKMQPSAATHSMASSDESKDATEHINKSLEVVRKMDGDPQVKALLQEAKGVFVVPDYGRAALIVGGQGGAGVLLIHRDGKWSGPAFYNMGGISVGAQAGASGGSIAMILMNDKAVQSFGHGNKFSLNADAGLTIIDYSKRAHGAGGRGDVVVWSDTKGAFANASVSVTDVNYDEKETRAYYGQAVTPESVVSGNVSAHKSADLLHALPG